VTGGEVSEAAHEKGKGLWLMRLIVMLLLVMLMMLMMRVVKACIAAGCNRSHCIVLRGRRFAVTLEGAIH